MPANTPSDTATIEQLYAWLVEMSVQVRQPENVSSRIDDALRIYADKLSAYRPEIVQKVLEAWPNTHSHWPAWKELAEALSDRKYRRAIPDLTDFGIDR